MHLSPIHPAHIDRAWKDGAHLLGKSCETSGGEITGDQLKLILSRGERTLVAIVDESPVGWGVVRVDQLPNVRVLHVCDMYAPGVPWADTWPALQDYAREAGCSEIRCCAKPAQARLYRMKCGFESVYETLRFKL
jgi:hypothetical protein